MAYLAIGPIEAQLSGLILAGREFRSWAAILRPSALGDPRIKLDEELESSIYGEAAKAAEYLGFAVSTLSGLFPQRAWVDNIKMRMALPAFLELSGAFFAVATRWGFAAIAVEIDKRFLPPEGPALRPHVQFIAEALRLPLEVHEDEWRAIDRAMTTLERVGAGGPALDKGEPFVLTPRGMLRREPEATDRIAIDVDARTITLDGEAHGPMDEQAVLFALAIVEAQRQGRAITFPQMEAEYPQLQGGNSRQILDKLRRGLPPEMREAFGSVQTWRFDPPPL